MIELKPRPYRDCARSKACVVSISSCCGHRKALISGDGVEPGRADILSDPILKVAQKLLLRVGSRSRFGVHAH